MKHSALSSTIAAGGVFGAVLISVMTHFILRSLNPHIIYGGQYGGVFLETLPIGVLVGAALGAITAGRSRLRARWAALATIVLIVTSVLLGPLLGIIGAMFIGLISVMWQCL
jgi:hypothetical protein